MSVVGIHTLHHIIYPLECKCPVGVNRAKRLQEVSKVKRKMVVWFDVGVFVQLEKTPDV